MKKASRVCFSRERKESVLFVIVNRWAKRYLMSDQFSIGDAVGLEYATSRKHAKSLCDDGLVQCKKVGDETFYRPTLKGLYTAERLLKRG